MKLVLKTLLAVTALVGAGLTHAQSVAVRVGTTGAGLEVGSALSSRLGMRVHLLGGSISHDLTESGIRYDGKFKMSNGSLLLDLHPFAGSFRISGGLTYNNNRIDATATPEAGFIEISGVRYTAAEVGRLHADLRWDKASPYVGIGWGSSPVGGRGLFLTTDLGVLYQTPTVSLTGVCGPALPALACQQLQSDIRAEEAQLRNDLADVKWYPVLSLGIGYRF